MEKPKLRTRHQPQTNLNRKTTTKRRQPNNISQTTSFNNAPCTSFSCTIQGNIFIDFSKCRFFSSLIVETFFYETKRKIGDSAGIPVHPKFLHLRKTIMVIVNCKMFLFSM
ncbi:hypothetical protein DPEC_G00233210 [Dallia pectoralis]|uniref:Uncharacterized protein n=1 Tax=Dallia pectoralis TaxID=75939 RepID=A0ACC2FXV6_DALPE|nr:hypothetical protein DPEC_G00233210 [Dallia pectoralis]